MYIPVICTQDLISRMSNLSFRCLACEVQVNHRDYADRVKQSQQPIVVITHKQNVSQLKVSAGFVRRGRLMDGWTSSTSQQVSL